MKKHYSAVEPASRRVILLLGSPRSGTSWLAKILDTHPNVFYAHEPLRKTWVPHVRELVNQLRTSPLSAQDRLALIDDVARARHHHVKPPFFPKDFIPCPSSVRGLLWKLMGFTNVGKSRFAHWFSPPADGPHDLLIKEVDWLGWVPSLIAGLRPDHFIVIIRHAGAVVSSRLKGTQSGMMDSYRAGWLEGHAARARELGFSQAAVEKMDLCRFFALSWTLQNLEYLEAAGRHPSASVVSYEDLCRDPHPVSDRLFAALGWSRNPRTIRFVNESTGRGVRGGLRKYLGLQRAYYGVYRNPAAAAMAWRNALSREQQQGIKDVVAAAPALAPYADFSALAAEPPDSPGDGRDVVCAPAADPLAAVTSART